MILEQWLLNSRNFLSKDLGISHISQKMVQLLLGCLFYLLHFWLRTVDLLHKKKIQLENYECYHFGIRLQIVVLYQKI